MSARVAQTPPSPYRPEGTTDCMVECLECGVEWGWGAPYEECKQWAVKHNEEIHND